MSATATDSAVAEAPAAAPPSVGSQLRTARAAAQLTVDDIARALKFSPRQVEALEADNYAALPGGTIVRGFVRNYARLLKVDAEALLRQIDAAVPSAPVEVRPPDNMGAAGPPQGLNRFPPLLATVLVVSMAALLLGLWYFFAPSAPTRTVVGPAADATRQMAEPAAPALVPVLPSAGGNVVPPQASAPADLSAPALRFSFSARSWIEVLDRTGRSLHSGENPAGAQLVLTGAPPFDIVIGNAAAVSLSYGDRPVDLAPHTRAEVARLRLE